MNVTPISSVVAASEHTPLSLIPTFHGASCVAFFGAFKQLPSPLGTLSSWWVLWLWWVLACMCGNFI
ncbi:hypothetical protein NL676_010748 [Syzygium grande]|nr:hypothetical protein NL676_010748 [Syzygium grande]